VIDEHNEYMLNISLHVNKEIWVLILFITNLNPFPTEIFNTWLLVRKSTWLYQ